MQKIEKIITNPPEELIVEIGKEIATNRMLVGDAGAFIKANCSREQLREMIDVLWNGPTEIDEKQRSLYRKDAETALKVLTEYLSKGE
mgnify:CR=1 FL=1|jgi:hypothetical protein